MLAFSFYPEKDAAVPFPRRPEVAFVYPRTNRSPLAGHDMRENPSSCDCAEIRTHVAMSEGFEVTK